MAGVLRRHELHELPTALVPDCGPGAETTLVPGGGAATHGNLRVALTAAGKLEVTRADTGAGLFTATPGFATPSIAETCSTGALLAGGDIGKANVSLAEALRWCKAEPECRGFTTRMNATGSCDVSKGGDAIYKVYYKNTTDGDGDPAWRAWTKPSPEIMKYLVGTLEVEAADASERLYGLGQGNWTRGAPCPAGPQAVVPLERNGQTVQLLQRKFHVTIPFVYSTAGFGLLWNMPGSGVATMGAHGTGGSSWRADAVLGLDLWVTAVPAGAPAAGAAPAAPIYKQYADATGHAPPLREDAMLFWQSRNRYKSSDIALGIADRYAELNLPVGVVSCAAPATAAATLATAAAAAGPSVARCAARCFPRPVCPPPPPIPRLTHVHGAPLSRSW